MSAPTLPERHYAIHENTIRRIQVLLAALYGFGEINQLDFESIDAAIDKDRATTDRLRGVNLDVPE